MAITRSQAAKMARGTRSRTAETATKARSPTAKITKAKSKTSKVKTEAIPKVSDNAAMMRYEAANTVPRMLSNISDDELTSRVVYDVSRARVTGKRKCSDDEPSSSASAAKRARTVSDNSSQSSLRGMIKAEDISPEEQEPEEERWTPRAHPDLQYLFLHDMEMRTEEALFEFCEKWLSAEILNRGFYSPQAANLKMWALFIIEHADRIPDEAFDQYLNNLYGSSIPARTALIKKVFTPMFEIQKAVKGRAPMTPSEVYELGRSTWRSLFNLNRLKQVAELEQWLLDAHKQLVSMDGPGLMREYQDYFGMRPPAN